MIQLEQNLKCKFFDICPEINQLKEEIDNQTKLYRHLEICNNEEHKKCVVYSALLKKGELKNGA